MSLSEIFVWMNEWQIAGQDVTRIGLALLVALVVYLILAFAVRFASVRAARMAERTATRVDNVFVEVFGATNQGLLFLAALLVGLGMLDLSDAWQARVGQSWFVALAVQLALWLNRAISVLLRLYTQRGDDAGTPQSPLLSGLLSWGLRTVLWTVTLLVMLSNLGINVTAFIASLGIGGIAIALAVQNILGDLFASFSIAVDRPFEIGDFIVVKGVSGTVEKVGLKTTRIRSLSGEQVVLANADMLKEVVNNYKRMTKRRIVFGFGVTYDTPIDKVAAIPQTVKAIIESSKLLEFNRAHFKKFGDSSLDFEVVYHVLDASFDIHMNEQQRINLDLMRNFAAEGINFAFPTRTVYMIGGETSGSGEGAAAA